MSNVNAWVSSLSIQHHAKLPPLFAQFDIISNIITRDGMRHTDSRIQTEIQSTSNTRDSHAESRRRLRPSEQSRKIRTPNVYGSADGHGRSNRSKCKTQTLCDPERLNGPWNCARHTREINPAIFSHMCLFVHSLLVRGRERYFYLHLWSCMHVSRTWPAEISSKWLIMAGCWRRWSSPGIEGRWTCDWAV